MSVRTKQTQEQQSVGVGVGFEAARPSITPMPPPLPPAGTPLRRGRGQRAASPGPSSTDALGLSSSSGTSLQSSLSGAMAPPPPPPPTTTTMPSSTTTTAPMPLAAVSDPHQHVMSAPAPPTTLPIQTAALQSVHQSEPISSIATPPAAAISPARLASAPTVLPKSVEPEALMSPTAPASHSQPSATTSTPTLLQPHAQTAAAGALIFPTSPPQAPVDSAISAPQGSGQPRPALPTPTIGAGSAVAPVPARQAKPVPSAAPVLISSPQQAQSVAMTSTPNTVSAAAGGMFAPSQKPSAPPAAPATSIPAPTQGHPPSAAPMLAGGPTVRPAILPQQPASSSASTITPATSGAISTAAVTSVGISAPQPQPIRPSASIFFHIHNNTCNIISSSANNGTDYSTATRRAARANSSSGNDISATTTRTQAFRSTFSATTTNTSDIGTGSSNVQLDGSVPPARGADIAAAGHAETDDDGTNIASSAAGPRPPVVRPMLAPPNGNVMISPSAMPHAGSVVPAGVRPPLPVSVQVLPGLSQQVRPPPQPPPQTRST
eukprot:jgi/Chlat1/5902/Chrsp4S06245